MDADWKSLTTLKKVGSIPTGMYTYDYYSKYKKQYRIRGASYNTLGGDPICVGVPEYVKLRKNGAIVEYRIDNSNSGIKGEIDIYSCISKDTTTRLGIFGIANHGEFGGELITPTNKHIKGNFTSVFEWNNNVYAVDTLSHLGSRHFKLYRFINASKWEILYDTGSTIKNSIGIDALYIEDNNVYFIESGMNIEKCKHIATICKMSKENKIEKLFDLIYDIADKKSVYAKSLLVDNNFIYIGCDKALVIINMATKSIEYYTFLSDEDIKDINNAEDLYSAIMGGTKIVNNN